MKTSAPAGPKKPLLIFDGDCTFCRRWIFRWRLSTGDRVDYEPYQKAAPRFPEISEERFRRSVQLVESDGRVSGGAEAVFRTLTYGPRGSRMLFLYQKVPGVRPATEWFYRLVADHRVLFSRLTQLLWGDHLEPSSYEVSRRLFLKLVALTYAVAFASLGVQVLGLIGSEGILPARELLGYLAQKLGPQRFFLVPTALWLSTADPFMLALCWSGVLLAAMSFFEIAAPLVFFLLWLVYLSFVTVGQDFLAFQWDNLLLEVGFLAIFFAPLRGHAFAKKTAPAPSPATWTRLFQWLLFRLMFGSGMVKLRSHDPNWRNLTALQYHYETQPLPAWTSWIAHQLPGWFQRASVAGMFAIELAVPFLIFAPRRPRAVAAALLALLQFGILVTGNYCFFNFLTIALCLLLLDDGFWPIRIRNLAGIPLGRPQAGRNWPRPVRGILLGLVLAVTIPETASLFKIDWVWPAPLESVVRAARPFRSMNSYGLFAVMTTARPEIVLEGSYNGVTWKEYEFRWKPGDVRRRPRFVQPHQPRLDWQMWFAALGTYKTNPWFIYFCGRLMKGSKPVARLLGKNPFPDDPPRYIRAVLYDYRFTDPETRRKTGAWWTRERKGLYCPVLSLRS